MPGFPVEAIKFYQRLKDNNNRDWFLANKKDYITYVQEPAIEIVQDLGFSMQKILPKIQFDTSTSGSGSIMRIQRDTRFSKDKTPYKTWLGIRLWEGHDRKNCASRFFLYINNEGGGLYVGSHHFDKNQLIAYQLAVANNKKGAELAKILSQLGKEYDVGGECYKRVPKAFPADHERADLLKHKAIYGHLGNLSIKDVTSKDLTKKVITHFTKLAPLHSWMCQVLK